MRGFFGVECNCTILCVVEFMYSIYIYIFKYPRHPVIFSADDWGVQSPPQHNIQFPLPFSEGDWIPRDIYIYIIYT